MRLSKLALLSAGLLIAAPGWAAINTYYVGFEDTNGGDYDYNDLIFSISGENLTLIIGQNTPGTWQSNPTINNAPSPFWDHQSSDGGDQNVGHCIYGGGTGACANGGVIPLLPGAEYLATVSGGAVNNVSFTVSPTVGAKNDVTSNVYVNVSASTTRLGWYQSNSSLLNNELNSVVSTAGGVFKFDPTPNTPFGLWGCVNDSSGICTGRIFASQTGINFLEGTNGDSHFAFFRAGTPLHSPEPASVLLLGSAGLFSALALRRRFAKK